MNKRLRRAFAGLMTLVLIMCSIAISPQTEAKALVKGDDGSYSRNFDSDGIASDDFFTIGKDSAKKTGVSREYGDVTYKQALKMNSKGLVSFTPKSDGKLLLVYNKTNAGLDVLVGGEKHTLNDEAILEVGVKANVEVEVKYVKKETALFYIKYTPVAGESGHVCKFDNLISSKEATCTEDGYKEYKCSVADCEETSKETIPAAHKYNKNWTVDTEATETTTGSMSRHCSVEGCDGVTDERIIPILGSEIAPEGSYVYNFSKDDETDGYFTLTGDALTSSSAEWGTLEFTKAFKFNSNGSITFKAETAGKLTLFFNWTNAGNTINVAQDSEGEICTIDTSGVVSANVNAGMVTIIRNAKKESQCYYIRFTPEIDMTKTGLCEEDGEWKYYKDGVIDNEYAGIAINDIGMWYVANGTVDWNYTGLVKYSDITCYVKNGQVCHTYTGLVDVDGEWKYVTNGVVDNLYNGLVENEHGTWLLKNGVIDTVYSGLLEIDGEWAYIKDGALASEFTGLVENEYGWWYIVAGKADMSYKGLVDNSEGIWYVTEGKIDFEFTGLAEKDGEWIYVSCGGVNDKFTGLYENEYGWWYISAGKVDESYSGLVANDNGIWYVTEGKIDFEFTGLVKAEGETWAYVSCGGFNDKFSGLVENEYGWWYVSDGYIDFSYTGEATNDLGTWNVVNGKVEF